MRSANVTKVVFCLSISLAGTFACSGRPGRSEAGFVAQARDLFGPLPAVMASPDNPVTPEKAALGKALFYESRVSTDGTVSCVRCHPLALYAADGLTKSVGNNCRVSDRNAPTVLNAAGQIAAHWIGNRTGVEDQARQSLTGPASFGLPSEEAAAARLKAIPGYAALFEKAFPDDPEPVTAGNFALAVGAFERTLLTPAPFDAFLAGKGRGLDDVQAAGLKDFISAGCSNCHNGPYFGGRSYQRFGVAEAYWKRTFSPGIDQGRYAVTKNEADRYVFKVPILRNVQMTAPYFHDGSVGRLEDAVWIMGQVQLGTDLAAARVKGMVEFLRSLTGRIAAGVLEVPVLPSSEPGGEPGSPARRVALTPPGRGLIVRSSWGRSGSRPPFSPPAWPSLARGARSPRRRRISP